VIPLDKEDNQASHPQKVATQILAGKIMRKCHVDKVLTLVVSLAA